PGPRPPACQGWRSDPPRDRRPRAHPLPSYPMNAIPMNDTPAATRERSDARADRMFRYALTACVAFVLVALAGAALSMLWGGRHALEVQGLSFFFSSEWNPVENRFGALVPIYGTLVTALKIGRASCRERVWCSV